MAERKIGGETYRTEALPAREGLKLWYRIIKAFGPAIEKLPAIFSGMQGAEAERAAANTLACGALVSIMEGLDEDRMLSLLEDILKAGMLKRASGSWDVIDLDMDFRDGLGNVFPVVLWIVREQFSDFFRGLQASGAAKLA